MRSIRALGFAVGCLIACVVACDSTFTRPELAPPDELAVTSVLSSRAQTHGVLLTKVSNAQPFEGDLEFVQGADVFIQDVRLDNRNRDSLRVPSRLPEDANYTTDAVDVVPGSTYTLSIQTQNKSIRGRVAVPDTFVGWSQDDRLVWTQSAGASQYQVSIEDAQNTSFEFQNQFTVADTTVEVRENALVGTASDTLQPGSYFVEIRAQDPNLTQFLQSKDDRAGIRGGFGLFGAETRISGVVSFFGNSEQSPTSNAQTSIR